MMFEDGSFMNIAPEPAAGIGMCRLVAQLGKRCAGLTRISGFPTAALKN